MPVYCVNVEVRITGSAMIEADDEAGARRKAENCAPIEDLLGLMATYDNVNVEVEHVEEVPTLKK